MDLDSLVETLLQCIECSVKFEVEAVAAIRDWKWHGKNGGDPIFHVCDKMCSPTLCAARQRQHKSH